MLMISPFFLAQLYRTFRVDVNYWLTLHRLLGLLTTFVGWPLLVAAVAVLWWFWGPRREDESGK